MFIRWWQKILSYFSQIWFLWILAVIFNIVSFLVIFYQISPSGKVLALRYNVLAGVMWFGPGANLYWLPGIGILIGVANLLMSYAQKSNQYFIKFLPAFVSLTVQITIFISVLFLKRVN